MVPTHPSILPTQRDDPQAYPWRQAQTPEQRKRNMKFSRLQDAKRGKPVVSADLKTKQEYKRPPVSPFWASTLFPALISIGESS